MMHDSSRASAAPHACYRCLLTDRVPGLRIDASGQCDICVVTPPPEELKQRRALLRREMEAAIATRRGDGRYQCIVAYSGGKDSSFTLKLLVEVYGLRCLAITVDNGFLAGRTLDNCRAVCGALGVDHLLVTPRRAFMDRLFRTSAVEESLHPPSAVKRASSICNSCINLINTFMVQKALEMGIPLIASGYIAGQLPRDSAFLTIRADAQERLRAGAVRRYVELLGEEARHYIEVRPPEGAPRREIAAVNPLLGLALGEGEIIAQLEPLGWRRPLDAGRTSTNCRMNDLGVHIHHHRHGFHPYALEIAEQLRHGLMTREEAAARLEQIPSRGEVAWLADRIGLDLDAV